MSVDVSELSAHLPEPQRKTVRAEYQRKARSATTAFILCFFLGIFGAHCFYLGQPRKGLLRLVLSPLIVPGIVLEIIDLLHIDRDVEHDNLVLAEQLIARAALSVPLSAAAIAAAPHVVGPVPSLEPAPVSPFALEAAPIAGEVLSAPATAEHNVPVLQAGGSAAASTVDEAPPIWPYDPDFAPESASATPADANEPASQATLEAPSQPEPAAPIGAPYAADTPDTAQSSQPSAAEVDPEDSGYAHATPIRSNGAEAAPWLGLAIPAALAPLAFDAALAHEPAALPTDSPAAEPAAVPEEGLAGAEEPTSPPYTPANVTRPLDYTDHAAIAEPAYPAADVGEDTGARLSVVLPGYPLTRPESASAPAPSPESEMPESAAAESEAAADSASVVFVADPAYATPAPSVSLDAADVPPALPPTPPDIGRDTGTTPLGATEVAALGGLAAAFAAPHPPAEPEGSQAPEAPRAPAPASSADAGTSEGQTRVVKRVRVVRRLVVDGKVVHEAVAEQVVDPDVDTAATASSLQEALRTGDGQRIAALTTPLQLPESDAPPPDAEYSPPEEMTH